MTNLSIDAVLIILLACVLIAAAIIDIRVQKIPNLLTYPVMIIALVYHSIMNGFEGLLFGAEGLILGIAIFVLPYLMGGMGAGDVKLMGAVGAVIGPRGVFNASLFTAIIGGIYAFVLLLFQYKDCLGVITRSVTMLKTYAVTGHFIRIPAAEDQKKPKLCYGLAIASGALFTICWKLSKHSFPL